MTIRRTDEELIEGREIRRCKYEARYVTKLDRQIDAADEMIGELCREGRQVFYVCAKPGLYREGTRSDLIAYLIRNRYV